MTIASPAIGIPGASSALSSFVAYAGARLLSRSGAQLYGRDDFARGKGLLEILAEPGSAPYDSLLEYERVSIYANAVNDRTVPFATGAFQAHDPFATATKRAIRSRAKRGAPPDPLDPREPLDVREGGLEVTTHEHFKPVVLSIREIEPIVRPSERMELTCQTIETKVKLGWSESLPRPPAPFRPSTWSVLSF